MLAWALAAALDVTLVHWSSFLVVCARAAGSRVRRERLCPKPRLRTNCCMQSSRQSLNHPTTFTLLRSAKAKPYIASMGIYVMSAKALKELLLNKFPDANDFGNEVGVCTVLPEAQHGPLTTVCMPALLHTCPQQGSHQTCCRWQFLCPDPPTSLRMPSALLCLQVIPGAKDAGMKVQAYAFKVGGVWGLWRQGSVKLYGRTAEPAGGQTLHHLS